MATPVGMRINFTPEQKFQSVTDGTVREALSKIVSQLQGGATAGSFKLNGQQDTDGNSLYCRVKWAIDGDLEM